MDRRSLLKAIAALSAGLPALFRPRPAEAAEFEDEWDSWDDGFLLWTPTSITPAEVCGHYTAYYPGSTELNYATRTYECVPRFDDWDAPGMDAYDAL